MGKRKLLVDTLWKALEELEKHGVPGWKHGGYYRILPIDGKLIELNIHSFAFIKDLLSGNEDYISVSNGSCPGVDYNRKQGGDLCLPINEIENLIQMVGEWMEKVQTPEYKEAKAKEEKRQSLLETYASKKEYMRELLGTLARLGTSGYDMAIDVDGSRLEAYKHDSFRFDSLHINDELVHHNDDKVEIGYEQQAIQEINSSIKIVLKAIEMLQDKDALDTARQLKTKNRGGPPREKKIGQKQTEPTELMPIERIKESIKAETAIWEQERERKLKLEQEKERERELEREKQKNQKRQDLINMPGNVIKKVCKYVGYCVSDEGVDRGLTLLGDTATKLVNLAVNKTVHSIKNGEPVKCLEIVGEGKPTDAIED